MRFVAVKSAERRPRRWCCHELLVRQRTQVINALRGHATEFGVVGAKGACNASKLVARIEADATIPAPAKEMLSLLGPEIADLDDRVAGLDRKMAGLHKPDPVSKLLAEVRGPRRWSR